MIRLIPLLCVVLLLVGCSASLPDLSTRARHTSLAPAQQATPVVVPAPTDVASNVVSPDPPAASTTAVAAPTATPSATPYPTPTVGPAVAPDPPPAATWSYPIGVPGRPLGDGFFLRHAYLVENTWFNPGYWHTGEDWYALEGETAGANVYAVADGEVVYAGADYPGRVVIVAHAGGLFSMYGHLDPALAVEPGQQVAQGTLLGTVLRRSDDVPNHLHFEIRTFLVTSEVNGEAPRYGFACGPNCPPGPGYWPIAAPELPTALGWRNPTHVIARRAFSSVHNGPISTVVVAARPTTPSTTLWAEMADDGTPQQSIGELPLQPGERFPLLEVWAGVEEPYASSAQAYALWYRILLPDGRSGWVQAAVPSRFETGADGRPASVYLNFYPAVAAP